MRLSLRLGTLLVLTGLFLAGEQAFAQEYVGSDKCKMCHSAQHADWLKSGHPYKLQKLSGSAGPVYPEGLSADKIIDSQVNYVLKPGVPRPPKGYTWDQIGWVMGGYHSNARFLNKEGFLILGDSCQYNLITDKWVEYTQKAPGTASYAYACYKCHVTGASKTKTPEFAAYPGIEGSWSELGVGCEGCHGPGSAHLANFSQKPPKEGLETCNNCHARDRGDTYTWNFRVEWRKQTVNGVPTGFIRHREQGDMLRASKHGQKGMSCITCHNPHKGVYFVLGGLKPEVTCEGCHSNHVIAGHGQDKAECVDCHMPFSAKNGDVKTAFIAEQSSHFWEINTDPMTMFANLDTIGGFFFIKRDKDGRSRNTLDYACLQCHPNRDVTWASSHAKNLHSKGITSVAMVTAAPTAYTLTQNYPNPFNPTTTIDYTIPLRTRVVLSVYTISGQLVETLVDQIVPAGRHQVNFSAHALPSGTYLYQLQTEQFQYSRKMTVLK